jgi:hypothetical protein
MHLDPVAAFPEDALSHSLQASTQTSSHDHTHALGLVPRPSQQKRLLKHARQVVGSNVGTQGPLMLLSSLGWINAFC